MSEEQQNHSFLQKFNLPVSTLWSQYKVFFILCGVLVLIWKCRELIIDLLVSSSREAVKDAQKQDQTLRGEEKAANDQANQLRKEADALDDKKPVIDEDWNKKK
jgi:hypothetical protein